MRNLEHARRYATRALAACIADAQEDERMPLHERVFAIASGKLDTAPEVRSALLVLNDIERIRKR